MAVIQRVHGWLKSHELSVFLLTSGGLYVLLLAIWGTRTPLGVVQNIARLIPFKALYVFFFVNLILCAVGWTPVALRKCRRSAVPGQVDDLERYRFQGAFEVGGDGLAGLDRLRRHLRRRGFRVQTGAAGQALAAVRGRFAPLGDLVFHLSFLLLLGGILLSLGTRFTGEAVIVEGQPFWGEPGDYYRYTPPDAFQRVAPRFSFQVERIGAEFYGSELFFTDLLAEVRYPAETQERRTSMRLTQPARLGDANVTITGYGFAPVFELRDGRGTLIENGTVNLNLFPPGNEDAFRLPNRPHRVYLTFYPDAVLEDGVPRSRSNNLLNPLFQVRVFRNKVPVFRGILRPGEEARFDGLALRFPEVRLSGQARIVRDPGATLVFAGFLLGLGGLGLRLLWYRREVVALALPQGTGTVIAVAGESEFFRQLNHGWFEGVLRRVGMQCSDRKPSP